MEQRPPAGSTEAKQDGVEELPALVYREGEAIEMYEGHDAVISCTDDEPLDTLSIRKGYLSEDRREWFLDET
jgi:hypothetical protein